nr:MAG TPA: hypothetical protein [Caudoviricetes sp.]
MNVDSIDVNIRYATTFFITFTSFLPLTYDYTYHI